MQCSASPFKKEVFMRYFLIFSTFLISLFLHAETDIIAVAENDPNSLVEGVSVITGDLYRYEEDVIVQGVQPLKLSRSYFSQKGEGSWDGFSYQELFVKESSGNTTNTLTVEVTEPGGAILLYGAILVEDEPSTNDRESPRYSYIFCDCYFKCRR